MSTTRQTVTKRRGWRASLVFVLSVAVTATVWAETPQFRRLPVKEYRDKMKAGWIGQIAGVSWGAPTEFKFRDQIIPAEAMPKWTPAMINHAFGQDDLYVEMTFLRSMEQYGLDVPIRQAGIDFANSGYPLWCANNAGRTNLRNGIAPPDSSHPQFNRCPNDIDYQIEADFSGLIAPGLPNMAIQLGEKFGRLMNYGDGVYGGQFMGGMYAEAFFETDPVRVVEAGLKCIPEKSQYAEMVRDMLAWFRADPDDWEKTWQLAQEKYRRNPDYQKASNGGIDVKINGAYVLLGLLYGKGDLDQTIIMSCRGGQDSDCNPSSSAGVLVHHDRLLEAARPVHQGTGRNESLQPHGVPLPGAAGRLRAVGSAGVGASRRASGEAGRRRGGVRDPRPGAAAQPAGIELGPRPDRRQPLHRSGDGADPGRPAAGLQEVRPRLEAQPVRQRNGPRLAA